MERVNIFWFRRDLRLDDNVGLSAAMQGDYKVLPLFIFDTHILNQLEDKKDARLTFIYNQLKNIDAELKKRKSSLLVFKGDPLQVFQNLLKEYEVAEVLTNRDYEPYATRRDREIQETLISQGVVFKDFKDQVIFEKDEVVKDDGKPYTVFTPYMKKWRKELAKNPLNISENGIQNLYQFDSTFPSIEEIGFEFSDIEIPVPNLDKKLLHAYENQRNTPSLDATSKIGIHLRFGTISIRKLVKMVESESYVFLNELVWREFFMQILFHFPHVEQASFRKKYDAITWRNDEHEFVKWCQGKTGFPIVDAGMRQLNETGFMHNRVRMIVASFLVKDLLIDWRWGEAYFANKLLDFELSSNNGNWQWAAGTGCDAAPYFRIFNPTEQAKKFDPDHKYIKKWVPEYGTSAYPETIVDHSLARKRTLEVYKEALG